jgi:hypothetical protein
MDSMFYARLGKEIILTKSKFLAGHNLNFTIVQYCFCSKSVKVISIWQ